MLRAEVSSASSSSDLHATEKQDGIGTTESSNNPDPA